jgi:hypothetical protein
LSGGTGKCFVRDSGTREKRCFKVFSWKINFTKFGSVLIASVVTWSEQSNHRCSDATVFSVPEINGQLIQSR